MPKTLEQIQEVLLKRYNGPILEKNGFSYIPWNEAVKHLDHTLGGDVYDLLIKSSWREEVNDTTGYAAIVSLVIRPSDAPAFTREGLGFCELLTTKSGVALIDTAIKGAASNGIVRAVALLGDFGGLFLYDKDIPATTPGSNTSPAASEKPVLSEARENVLRNKGFSPAAINMIQTQWTQKDDWKKVKALFDDLFQNKLPGTAAMKKYGLGTTREEDDEYPFA